VTRTAVRVTTTDLYSLRIDGQARSSAPVSRWIIRTGRGSRPCPSQWYDTSATARSDELSLATQFFPEAGRSPYSTRRTVRLISGRVNSPPCKSVAAPSVS
jgi:hypothetical protein